jgi:superfamily II DNA/RNA helicase
MTSIQLSLFDKGEDPHETKIKLPAHERFPYNYAGQTVKPLIFKDLLNSKKPLILTGYTSLGMIIEFLASCYLAIKADANAFKEIQIFIGNEPNTIQSGQFRVFQHELSEEVKTYWLQEKGMSIFLCAKIIIAIELIKNGNVIAKINNSKKPFHSKIFKGDKAITLGSSNFSKSGLEYQIEMNSRYEKSKETKRYEESCQAAESYWMLGRDYNSELTTLLELLLSVVTWQEALARACAELLEGDWSKRYIPTNYFGDEAVLWPSQEQGIAHALWVIENVGSVLVADATGSGKTLTGAYLIKSVIDKIWGTGRMQKEIPVLICPPSVEDSWRKAALESKRSFQILSHGVLSHSGSKNYQDTVNIIRRTQVLAVDEAHGFLNKGSSRTKILFNNIADHVLLFTATPINRGPQDLIAIIDLLGADNFNDDILDLLSQIHKRRGDLEEKISKGELEKLQKAIQKFTVRRTKTMLNSMIDDNPEQFRDKYGKLCRYPNHQSKIYSCNETEQDCNLAREIRELANSLRGLVNLKKALKLPEFWVLTEEEYLEWRLNNAATLVTYNIMSSLRSSRVALLEHIYGTEYAQGWANISDKVKTKPTGNVIQNLLNSRGKPLENTLEIDLPTWLTDPAEYQEACFEEIAIYERVAELTKQISSSREQAKTQKLISLLAKHSIIIAFDRNLITLAEFHNRLKQFDCEVIVATGDNQASRQRANTVCELGSNATGVIVLCSDAMSEGINLQQSSAVVHLDMPTVVRVAEQRIGRVDRMDSPHKIIEVFLPKDKTEFTLSSDKKFLNRVRFVSQMLGSNMPLPEEIIAESELPNVIARLEEAEKSKNHWDNLQDVFAPVRALISGEQALIDQEIYEQLRTSKARVVSSVRTSKTKHISMVSAKHSWAFFALAGTEWGAPRWVYLDNPQADPITDLEEISSKLRDVLDESAVNLPKEQLERAVKVLREFVDRLGKTEELLLPKKKQRALLEMRIILKAYREEAVTRGDKNREQLIQTLLLLAEHNSEDPVELGSMAECWLELIRPTWYKNLNKHRRPGPLRLKDIREVLISQEPLSTQELKEKFSQGLRATKPLDERIVATIVGIL